MFHQQLLKIEEMKADRAKYSIFTIPQSGKQGKSPKGSCWRTAKSQNTIIPSVRVKTDFTLKTRHFYFELNPISRLNTADSCTVG